MQDARSSGARGVAELPFGLEMVDGGYGVPFGFAQHDRVGE